MTSSTSRARICSSSCWTPATAFSPAASTAKTPSEPSFVGADTIDQDTDMSEVVPMPAGVYTLTYLESLEPGGPNFTVDLEYDTDLEIATSPTLMELAVPDDGPSLRLHFGGTVAALTQLAPDSINDFWPIPDGPEGWIGALDDVTVSDQGTGTAAGVSATFWELQSQRAEPIAILGDGPGWVAETILEPGRPIRLWWIDIGGWPVIMTEDVPAGTTLEDADTDLTTLRDGVTVDIRE